MNSEGIIAVCLAQNCAIEAMTQDIDWEQILNYDKLFRVTSYIHIEVPLKTASKSLPDPEASALESDKGGREGRWLSSAVRRAARLGPPSVCSHCPNGEEVGCRAKPAALVSAQVLLRPSERKCERAAFGGEREIQVRKKKDTIDGN